MSFQKSVASLLSIASLIIFLVFCNPTYAYDNANLLPKEVTPVLDLAKSLTKGQKSILEQELNEYEQQSGWKIRVLTQFEDSPGIAIKDFWEIDERTLLVIADPRGGNLINFNVGDSYFSLLPRLFWVELQSRFGNQFYVRDYGEDSAIIESIKSIKTCLDVGGCQKVPGLTKDQILWSLAASILGGLIAGIASSPRKENEFLAWKWLLLVSPIWFIPFGVIGIAQVVTRTTDLIPLIRNIVAFITSAIASNMFARNTLGKTFNSNPEK